MLERDFGALSASPPVDDLGWQQLLDHLCAALDASSAGIVSTDCDQSRMLYCARPTSLEAQLSYAQHFSRFDPIPRSAQASGIAVVKSLHAVQPRKKALNNPMIVDWAIPNGMGQALYCRLGDANHRLTWLCVAFPFELRASAMAQLATVARPLARYISSAFELHSRLRSAAILDGFWLSIADTLPYPLIALDESLRVLQANQAAAGLRSRREGLALRHGKLVAFNASDTNHLRSLVHGVINSGIADGWVGRGEGGRVFLVDIFRPPVGSWQNSSPCALMLVRENRPLTDADVHRFGRHYGLTEAEIRISKAVAAGSGLTAVAEDFGVSHATVRAHLQHIFDKCDLHSQAALTARMHELRAIL